MKVKDILYLGVLIHNLWAKYAKYTFIILIQLVKL